MLADASRLRARFLDGPDNPIALADPRWELHVSVGTELRMRRCQDAGAAAIGSLPTMKLGSQNEAARAPLAEKRDDKNVR